MHQPTGNESLVEKWILHKLNVAAKELNAQMTERNFMMATTAAYNFWLYELCDVYIVRPSAVCATRPILTSLQEAMKPMTDEGASVEDVWAGASLLELASLTLPSLALSRWRHWRLEWVSLRRFLIIWP